MSTEDRLRTALHAAADDTDVDPGSFDRIERRTARARRRRRAVGGGVAAALIAVAVAVPLALRDGGGESVEVGPAGDSREPTTTTSPTTEPPPAEPTTEPAADHAFVWPAPGDDRRFDTREDLVAAFAEEYLGIVRPVVAPAGDSSFTARPRSEGGGPAPVEGPRTVVEVATVDGRTAVVGAASPNILVDAPQPRATVSSPVQVSGQARNLFEGNVLVDVRDEAGAAVATRFTTATGSGPQLADFSVDVPFDATGRGTIVVKSASGLAGTPEATVVPVTFGAGQPTTELTVYLVDDRGDFVPVTRQVPRTTGVLRAALLELLGGATPEEEARGLSSPFDDDTDLLLGVTITEDRTAVVDLAPDFGERIPNSSTSAMSYAIVGSLDRTVFQFPSVTWVTYRFGGECGTFGELDPALLCERRTRDQY